MSRNYLFVTRENNKVIEAHTVLVFYFTYEICCSVLYLRLDIKCMRIRGLQDHKTNRITYFFNNYTGLYCL